MTLDYKEIPQGKNIHISVKDGSSVIAVCNVMDELLLGMYKNKLNINFLKITMFPKEEEIRLSFDKFKLFTGDNKEDFMELESHTVITNTARDSLTEEQAIKHHIHTTIEIVMENWLKFGFKELEAAYKDRKFYIQIPQGFSDGRKYWDSLDGWSTDATFWKPNYNVQDEVHRVGGLKINEEKNEN